MIVAGLGGFRGLVAEAVWFRADRLQDEGRYAELAQLATWLTFLEPHTPEVWAYAAWNLAYNVSVMMPGAEDRWRWVQAGLRLLRDDGLRLNPADPVLHRELAWLFLFKIGGNLDEAWRYYRKEWRAISAQGPEAMGLSAAVCAELDAEYGKQDWGDPYASALYWSHVGMRFAKRPEQRMELRQILYQTLMVEARHDPRFAPRALKELRVAYGERPHPELKKVIDGFRARFSLE